MKKILLTLCCAALSASAIELAAWRGETVTAKLPAGEKVGKAPAGLTEAELTQIVRFACCAASLSTQKHGGITSVPDEAAVLALL